MPDLEIAIERQLVRKFVEKGELDPLTPLPRNEEEMVNIYAADTDPSAILISPESSKRLTPYTADLVRFLGVIYKAHLNVLSEMLPESGMLFTDIRRGTVAWPAQSFQPEMTIAEMEDRVQYDYADWRSIWSWPLLDIVRELHGWHALTADVWFLRQKTTGTWGQNTVIQINEPIRKYMREIPWFSREPNVGASREIRLPVLPTSPSFEAARAEIMQELKGVITRYELRPSDNDREMYLAGMRQQMLSDALAKAQPGQPVTLLVARPSDLTGVPPALIFSQNYPEVTIMTADVDGVKRQLDILRALWIPKPLPKQTGLQRLRKEVEPVAPMKLVSVIALDLFRANPDIYSLMLEIADHARSFDEAERMYKDLFSQYKVKGMTPADLTFPEGLPLRKAGLVLSLDVMPTIAAFLLLALEYRLLRRLGVPESDLPVTLEQSRWLHSESSEDRSRSKEFMDTAASFLKQILGGLLFTLMQMLAHDDGWLVAAMLKGRYSKLDDSEPKTLIPDYSFPLTVWSELNVGWEALREIAARKKGDGEITVDSYFVGATGLPELKNVIDVITMKPLRVMHGDQPLLRLARSDFPQKSSRAGQWGYVATGMVLWMLTLWGISGSPVWIVLPVMFLGFWIQSAATFLAFVLPTGQAAGTLHGRTIWNEEVRQWLEARHPLAYEMVRLEESVHAVTTRLLSALNSPWRSWALPLKLADEVLAKTTAAVVAPFLPLQRILAAA